MVHMQDGDYNESSDIDIMILVDLDEDEKIKKLEEISYFSADLGLEYNIILSPIIKNIDKFNSWLDVKSFYMNVVNEGVILYGKKYK